jgi:hypothetical protein
MKNVRRHGKAQGTLRTGGKEVMFTKTGGRVLTFHTIFREMCGAALEVRRKALYDDSVHGHII